MKAFPSLDYLREALSYNADTGVLSWRPDRPDHHFKNTTVRNRWRGIHAGKPITCVGSHGYIVFNLNKKMLLAHRVCYAMHNNIELTDLPEQIDHKDTCRTNNRAKNFRAADPIKNSWNSSLTKSSTTGFKGVSWGKQRGKWRATIAINRKHTHLGFFDTKEEAHAAYAKAANDNFGEFARSA